MNLTANQFILLLDIYRGTYDKHIAMGTFQHDLFHLVSQRLVGVHEVAHTRNLDYVTTDLGQQYVVNALKGPSKAAKEPEEPGRRTGRTSRMLAEARYLHGQGPAVYVVCSSRSQANNLEWELRDLKGITFDTIKSISEVWNWSRMRPQGLSNPNCAFIFDTSALAQEFGPIIAEYHRWDRIEPHAAGLSSMQDTEIAFEKWCKAKHLQVEGGYKLEKTESGVYINAETRVAFRAYCEGRASLLHEEMLREWSSIIHDPRLELGNRLQMIACGISKLLPKTHQACGEPYKKSASEGE